MIRILVDRLTLIPALSCALMVIVLWPLPYDPEHDPVGHFLSILDTVIVDSVPLPVLLQLINLYSPLLVTLYVYDLSFFFIGVAFVI